MLLSKDFQKNIFLTVDCVVFGYKKNDDLQILLVKRGIEPFKNMWALPGGFLKNDETTENAAKRELLEETGLENIFIEQLYTFSSLERDPRANVISVTYYALIDNTDVILNATTDVSDAAWFKLNQLPELAFDHEKILNVALSRLQSKIKYQPIGFELLPDKFTLSELQHLYESILGRQLNKRNFRTKLMKMNILNQLEKQNNVSHRPAYLYEFNAEKYEELTEQGFEFNI